MSPTLIPATPLSQPLITSPTPTYSSKESTNEWAVSNHCWTIARNQALAECTCICLMHGMTRLWCSQLVKQASTWPAGLMLGTCIISCRVVSCQCKMSRNVTTAIDDRRANGSSSSRRADGSRTASQIKVLPSLKLKVLLPLVSSNTLPLEAKLPLYFTTTFFPGLASFPSGLPIASRSNWKPFSHFWMLPFLGAVSAGTGAA